MAVGTSLWKYSGSRIRRAQGWVEGKCEGASGFPAGCLRDGEPSLGCDGHTGRGAGGVRGAGSPGCLVFVGSRGVRFHRHGAVQGHTSEERLKPEDGQDLLEHIPPEEKGGQGRGEERRGEKRREGSLRQCLRETLASEGAPAEPACCLPTALGQLPSHSFCLVILLSGLAAQWHLLSGC